MTTFTTPDIASPNQLGKATGAALAVAGLILVTAVLPAEFGIDPTGAGGALGLTRLNGAAQAVTTVAQTGAPAAGTGSFTAPSDGGHGSYRRNMSDKPVMVDVTVSGVHDKLYLPATE